MQTVATVLWRRLDGPGHDACRLEANDSAWMIDGAAVFQDRAGQVAQLHYRVRCDRHWHTQWGTVRGWLGPRAVDLSIVREPRGWVLNDVPAPELGHCLDLDLGFTPATNLLAIRRLQLELGQRADAPAAWLDLPTQALGELAQRYERLDDSSYSYEAPRFDVAQQLRVSPEGMVLDYPGLWQAEGV